MSASIHTFQMSEKCLLIRFNEINTREAHHKVIKIYQRLKAKPFHGFTEAVPAYDSIAILFDPEKSIDIENEINELISSDQEHPLQPGKLHEIKVKYGGLEGPDLNSVAKENSISPEELIRLHTEREYDVYLVGFTGGFPYLGFTHEKLTTARKEKPDPRVPAGSVALAGNQTGIYPYEGPGAWKIIGRTEMCIFDLDQKEPGIIKPGDKIKFVEI